MSEIELYNLLYANYHKHYERVYGRRQQDPAHVWRRTLRSYERTYRHLVQNLAPDSRVLDIGCGTGILLKWLSDYHPHIKAVGVDSSPEEIAIARRALPNVELHVGEALEFLQANEGGFTGIFANHIIEHVPDELLLAWLRAIHSALIPGGFFCYRAPNAGNLLGVYHRYHDLTHRRIFADHSMLQLLDVGGFVNATLLPIKPGWVVGSLRQSLEYLLHRAIFWLSGQVGSTIFTTEICAVGYRRNS